MWLGRLVERVVDKGDPLQAFPVSGTGFVDVDPDQWWAGYVNRLAYHGITRGCRTDPDLFCPDQLLNREQIAAFLKRAFKLAAAESQGFADTEGTWAEAEIDAVHAAGIVRRCATNPLRFCPDGPVTRGEMAAYIHAAVLWTIVEIPR